MSGSEAALTARAIGNAIKASGVIVEVSSEAFLTIVRRNEPALIVHARSKIMRTTHKYLTSYKGLAFYTRVSEPLEFLSKVELIEAKKIAIPDM